MGKILLKILLALSLVANGVFVYLLMENNTSPASDTGSTETEEPSLSPTQTAVYESGNTYPLMRIIDGDTIVVGFDKQTQYVRLIGIDSPEPNDPGGPQCYAVEATGHLQELAQTGLVVLHFDESQGMHDSYGRLLAYVEIPDGTDLGKKMIEDGYAHEYTYKGPYARQEDYKLAENSAIEEERGLWAPEACQ